MTISPERAKEIMDSDTPHVVLDVREPEEYDEGYIPTAVNLPLGDVLRSAHTVVPNKDTAVLVYCRSGARSSEAAKKLEALGYTTVLDFGGILNWDYEVV